MNEIKLMDGKTIGNHGIPYFVAELNSSHNGNVETAKRMIDAAKACGCDAVKFQSWTADSLYCSNYYADQPIARRMVNRFSLDQQKLKELSDYCHEQGISFASTPYSKEEVDFLVEQCHVPFIKIASMDLNNAVFLEYIAQKQLPIVLSTGMGTLEEIEKAVKVIETAGNHAICILHCVSLYPVEASMVNLNNIKLLQNKFPNYPVGYSDHTIGEAAAIGAIALGAALIEKHFTLDNKKIGWDNQMATEPDAMCRLISMCKSTYLAMGHVERRLYPEEIEQRDKMRRSVVAAKPLEKGVTLTLEDLDAKRPGTGIPVSEMKALVGRKTKRSFNQNELILESDIE